MRRLVVLLAFSAGIASFAALACGGGNEKQPMTPDNVEATPPSDLSEAGAPEAPSTAAPAPSAAPAQ